MSDFISIFHYHNLHAAYFTYKGERYSFAGWWVLEWENGYKNYDSIDDFLNDPFFDGKRLDEILDQISDPDYDLEPW